MIQLFFTEKELRLIIDLLIQNNHKDLEQNILEQVFKQDLTNKEN